MNEFIRIRFSTVLLACSLVLIAMIACADIDVEYYDNGQKRSEYTMKDGDEHGPSKRWHKNGKLAAEGHWNRGDHTGKWMFWYENGQIEEERDYRRSTGSYYYSLTYYENGNKKEEQILKADIQGYFVKMWYDTEELSAEGETRGLRYSGEWTFYNKDGTVFEVKDFGY